MTVMQQRQQRYRITVRFWPFELSYEIADFSCRR
jgi:hypothetical protein